MVGMENGLFPHARSDDEGNLEEERRLCYVGITRARRQLYMSYAEMRRMHGVEQINAPSMFLKEIPPEHIVETRQRAQIVRPARSEEHTSELQSLMRISYAVFCLKKKHNQRLQKRQTT